ncbi:hypothetical protein G6F57_022078 [Rhizopus arrhizus]|nr:hypothetical protein G6F57_022078 [Rhizopus arrhizus]
MAVAQCGQSERAVLLCVGFIAGPHQGVGQQRDHHRQHFFPGETRPLEIARQPPPQRGDGLAKGDDAVELAGVALLRPVGVVAVLLAPTRIATGGLQVAVGVRADPHGSVGRRDGQRADAVQGGGIAHRVAVGIAVAESLAGAAAADAGLG